MNKVLSAKLSVFLYWLGFRESVPIVSFGVIAFYRVAVLYLIFLIKRDPAATFFTEAVALIGLVHVLLRKITGIEVKI